VRILITGASGFVGRHLAQECLTRGDQVHGTDRPGEDFPRHSALEWHSIDLFDDDSLHRALTAARPEGIIHLAGQANVALAHRDPVGTFRINAEGTLRLLRAVQVVVPMARTVAVSSAEIYGIVPNDELPVRETHPLHPQTPYGASKAAADLVAEQAARGWGMDVIRMRPFNHIGPGQSLGFAAPDFASQIASIERGESEPVLRAGNLSAKRDFTDVRDIVRGYRDAIVGGARGQVYNLCSGRAVAIEEIVRFFLDRARVPIRLEIDSKRLRPGDVPETRGDYSRAERDLGWRPQIPLEQSLSDVLEEWRGVIDGVRGLPYLRST
jgi:GDP-4-dehydro-6-deoxy-D-mannose reductase